MKSVCVFGDVHADSHLPEAVDLLCWVMEDKKPDIVVCVGDFVNMYSVSRHRKDPRRHTSLEAELVEARKIWKQINGVCKKSEKHFIMGNHETNLERYLQDKAPALCGMDGLSVQSLFEMEKYGWSVTEYRKFLKIGKVLYTHDLGASGKYALNKAVTEAGKSIVIGHTHRMGSVFLGTIEGKTRVAASFGWLGDPEDADYLPDLKARTDWAHGFGWGWMDDDGTTWFQEVPIIRGKCVVDGDIYSL